MLMVDEYPHAKHVARSGGLVPGRQLPEQAILEGSMEQTLCVWGTATQYQAA